MVLKFPMLFQPWRMAILNTWHTLCDRGRERDGERGAESHTAAETAVAVAVAADAADATDAAGSQGWQCSAAQLRRGVQHVAVTAALAGVILFGAQFLASDISKAIGYTAAICGCGAMLVFPGVLLVSLARLQQRQPSGAFAQHGGYVGAALDECSASGDTGGKERFSGEARRSVRQAVCDALPSVATRARRRPQVAAVLGVALSIFGVLSAAVSLWSVMALG